MWNSKYLHVRKVKKDVLEEMPVNFQELLCQNQTVTVEGGIVKLKVLTCEKSRKMYWKRYLWSSGRIFLKNVAENGQKTWFTFDAVLVQFWNYIKSASYFFGHFYIFFLKFCWKSSKNMMHFRCSFDAVLMQFWNCIKSASKPLEATSKVHQNDVVSKLHQNCMIIFGYLYIFFLKISWKSSKNMMHFWCSFDAV